MKISCDQLRKNIYLAMMEGNAGNQEQPEQLLSIRPQEMAYERELRNTYKDCPHLIVTHCSDLLHLDIAQRQQEGTNYRCLITRSTYNQYDVMMEIRGSIISYGRLKQVISDGLVPVQRLPVLLYLNHEQKLLLSPKNIGKYLFSAPRSSAPPIQAQNCYIQNHFGSKLLVIAGRDIGVGEELVLTEQSFSGAVYKFDPNQF